VPVIRRIRAPPAPGAYGQLGRRRAIRTDCTSTHSACPVQNLPERTQTRGGLRRRRDADDLAFVRHRERFQARHLGGASKTTFLGWDFCFGHAEQSRQAGQLEWFLQQLLAVGQTSVRSGQLRDGLDGDHVGVAIAGPLSDGTGLVGG
jgi:hypothetical protein